MTCYPGTNGLCWVCGGDHCELPPIDESQTTKQMERTYLNLDCMDAERGLPSFPDKYFDLAIVDPPYGIETRGNAQDRFRRGMQLKTANDDKPPKEYFDQLFRVSKNQIIWGYNHLSDMLPKCREFIFWYKHQPLATFSDGELAYTSFQNTAKCFDFPFCDANRSNKNKVHPLQKPKELYRWLLKNYANEGMKLLDTHVGSASSLVAFEEMGFEYVAFEKDPDYYRDSCKRLEAHRKQQSLFTGQEIFKASGGQVSLF